MANTHTSKKDDIRAELNVLQSHGVIDYYQIQSEMPGLRWSVCIKGRSLIAYSTAEITAFIKGAIAGLNA